MIDFSGLQDQLNAFENAASNTEDVVNSLGSAATELQQGLSDPSGWVANEVLQGLGQGPLNGIGNVFSNFGVFMAALLLILIGGLMMTFSWGEDLVDALGSNSAVSKIAGAAIE